MQSAVNLYIFAASAITAIVLVPYVCRLSVHVGGVDHPGTRKVHVQATPRLGGIAIFCSMLFTIILFCDINRTVKGFLTGAIIVFLTGLADDLFHLTPRQKFAGQFLAAGLAIYVGWFCVRQLGNPFGLGVIELGPLAVPFTMIGIVGVINAINLMDGLDGLAGGICCIVCVSFAVLSSSHNTTLFPLTIALLGALLGFLRYNSFPAAIFMGDSGSLLLGYCMGIFAVLASVAGDPPVSPCVPLVILGVPILDTLVVMANRRRAGRCLFAADNTHLHHRLLDLGIGHRYTVVIVFGVSYVLSLIAIYGRGLSDGVLLTLLAVTGACIYGMLGCIASGVAMRPLQGFRHRWQRSREQYRTLVQQSRHLVLGIKFLLIAVLLLPLFLTRHDATPFSMVSIFLLVVSVGIYLSQRCWSDMLLQSYIYVFGFVMVFTLENFGRDAWFLGMPLLYVSHLLFLLLLTFVVVKVVLRRRTSTLLVSPFEYLIMLIVMSTSLLPPEVATKFHLLSVAVKSVILFLAFKVVLMRQVRRNRKMILGIAVSTFIIVGRCLA